MGVDIWKVKYKRIYGPLSLEQFDFIDKNIPVSDDGTYGIDRDHLDELRLKTRDREELNGLIKTFEKYVRSGKGYFSFRIF